MAESSYTDPKVIEASRNYVNVVAHQETEHKSKEILVGREKVKVCDKYYTIPCETHTRAWSAIGKFFQGNFGTPTTVFCDPAGAEISRKAGSLGAGELVREMNTALGKVSGEKIHFMAWSQVKKLIADGDAALEKKEHKKAIEAYQRVAKMKGKAFAEMAEESMKKAAEAGDAALTAALALEDAAAKKKALQKIANDFKPLEVAAKAKKELEALK